MKESNVINVGTDDLEKFFMHHLNQIYTAKTLQLSQLPQLLENAHFSDLREAIDKTIQDVKQQIARMDQIYQSLPIIFSKVPFRGLTGMIEDSFSGIKLHSGNPQLRDMSVLFYLNCIECIEMASFQILEMVSVKLSNQTIKSLIRSNYEDAKANRMLILLINAKYISTAAPNHQKS
ncbi:DUF892 family protein [Dyadobacter sp. CY356]|uniref:DUF892 family protein n=1 Tax=Dyadobacter sp. CY356 TaxID=2906442 RepID=UPI001F3A6641|nr:DUF892 family protein [Dyadobacter sp. CY356]MCF0055213.1 ferritin-like domain-containing protein [Dyadobacter sp. CY356]